MRRWIRCVDKTRLQTYSCRTQIWEATFWKKKHKLFKRRISRANQDTFSDKILSADHALRIAANESRSPPLDCGHAVLGSTFDASIGKSSRSIWWCGPALYECDRRANGMSRHIPALEHHEHAWAEDWERDCRSGGGEYGEEALSMRVSDPQGPTRSQCFHIA